MHDRSAWTRTAAGPVRIKNKTYDNLIEFKRPCNACGKPFSIYVTEKIASGRADTNSFRLVNCEAHRRNKSAGETSEAVNMANHTMKQELDGLYTRVKDQFEEIQTLKGKLAQYELQPAMAAIGCEPIQNTTNGALPFPWERG